MKSNAGTAAQSEAICAGGEHTHRKSRQISVESSPLLACTLTSLSRAVLGVQAGSALRRGAAMSHPKRSDEVSAGAPTAPSRSLCASCPALSRAAVCVCCADRGGPGGQVVCSGCSHVWRPDGRLLHGLRCRHVSVRHGSIDLRSVQRGYIQQIRGVSRRPASRE